MSRGNLSVCRDRTTRENPMKLLRATAVAAAIFVLAPPPPASAQISSTAIWSCEFVNSPTDCGFNLQAFASNRATVVCPGRDGSTAAELTTQPGDSNLFGSGTAGTHDRGAIRRERLQVEAAIGGRVDELAGPDRRGRDLGAGWRRRRQHEDRRCDRSCAQQFHRIPPCRWIATHLRRVTTTT